MENYAVVVVLAILFLFIGKLLTWGLKIMFRLAAGVVILAVAAMTLLMLWRVFLT